MTLGCRLVLFLGAALSALTGCKSVSNSSRAQLLNEGTVSAPGSTLLSNADGSLDQWTGIGRLKASLSCTAFWVKVSDRPEAPAYAVTNGHCVQDYTARDGGDKIYLNTPVTEGWTVTFRYFYDTTAQQKTVKVKTLTYSTMKRTDLAILELEASQAELKAAGIQPLTLSQSIPAVKEPIQVVGIPLLQLAQEELYLRKHTCEEQGRTDVVEWFWFWSQLHRNDCADIVSGSSGSPVFNAKGEVFAVINTTTRDGNSDSCYLGNPCEISSTGSSRRKDTNYAANLKGIAGCWDKTGVWDLKQSSCPLDRRTFLGVQSKTMIPTNGKNRMGEPLNWDFEFSHPKPEALRFKKGLAQNTNCQDPAGYQMLQGPDDARLKEPLPSEQGVYFVCFAEGQDLEGSKKVLFPTTAVVTIDKTPPSEAPYVNVETFGDLISVEPIFAVPEYSFFRWAFGPITELRTCEGAELYPYRRQPFRFAADIPHRFCIQGDDHAGNPGQIIERIVPEKK